MNNKNVCDTNLEAILITPVTAQLTTSASGFCTKGILLRVDPEEEMQIRIGDPPSGLIRIHIPVKHVPDLINAMQRLVLQKKTRND